MKTHYIHPKSTKDLADYIDALENVVSITMTLNQLVKFNKAYVLGFKYNRKTYKDIPIKIEVGDANTVIQIDCD